MSAASTPRTLQQLVDTLQHYWAERGCLLHQPWDAEVGAGTMHPETFLRVLGPRPWKVAYVQPSRRPADGRYGENPNRLYKHMQYQVILKPAPADVQDLYLGSLRALGIDPAAHDVRFEEDNWESPTLGAWGIGWQVLLDGQEITQFTYFQQAGGIDLAPISAELTYGLERIAMYLQDVDDVYKVEWAAGRALRRGAPGGGVPALALLVRAGRRGAAPRSVRQVPEGGLAHAGGPRRPLRARRLRLVPEDLARLQRARRARRDLREPARGDDPRHPQARLRGGRPLRGRGAPEVRRA